MGMTVMEGKGFYYPVDTAVGKDDRLYVISRSKEETARGIRVTLCDAESGYYGNFGVLRTIEGGRVRLARLRRHRQPGPLLHQR